MPITGASETIPGLFRDKGGMVYNVKHPDYGAVGDDSTNDTTAIQAAIDAAVAAGGGTIYFPKGTYKITAALTLTEVRDIKFSGAGRYSTRIKQYTANTPTVQCNGLWYSHFEGLYFTTAASCVGKAVFELDGNYDGSHTLSVQGNTFAQCYFDANSLADYAFAVARQGTGSAQGSENLFLNCHFQAALTAGYYCNGSNALQNTFIGGNFQNCKLYGVRLQTGGTVSLIGVGFQNGSDEQTGYDISAINSANDVSQVINCRSESLHFLSAGNGHIFDVVGSYNVPGTISGNQPTLQTRSAAVAFNALRYSITEVKSDGRLWQCSVAGTTSATEPTWTGASVVDGTATFIPYSFNIVDGTVNLRRCHFSWGQISMPNSNTGRAFEIVGCGFSRPDWLSRTSGAGFSGYPNGLNGGLTSVNQTFGFVSNNIVRLGYAGQNGPAGAAGLPALHSLIANVPTVRRYTWTGLSGPLVFPGGSPGSSQEDVGIERGHMSTAAGPQVLGVLGYIGRYDASGADTAGTALQLIGGLPTGNAKSGPVNVYTTVPAGSSSTVNETTRLSAQVDYSATAGDTHFLLWDVNKGALSRVLVGAADSGGVGFKMLRVVN